MDIRADTKCNASTQFAFLLRFLLFYLFAAFCIWMLVCFLAILASRVTDQNENVDNMYGRKWNFSEVMFFYFCYSWPFTMVLCNYSSLVHISTFHSLHLLLAQDYSTHNMLGCNLNPLWPKPVGSEAFNIAEILASKKFRTSIQYAHFPILMLWAGSDPKFSGLCFFKPILSRF
jgi:hypothetical protein